MAINRRQFLQAGPVLLATVKLDASHPQDQVVENAPHWEAEFVNPPDSAHPWVYSFWMEGNITKEGITADLEAMRQAGLGGLLFINGALGNPAGPHRFMSESWREQFNHMLAEAHRLGLQVNLNNDPGWARSGGPWVKPEQASQKVIVSETITQGPTHFDGPLAVPAPINHDFYEDIAVLACPAPAEGVPSYRIPDYNTSKSFAGGDDFFGVVPWPRFIPTNPEWPAVAANQCVHSANMLDLTDKLQKNGRLDWDVPSGRWLVWRFGHTVANGGTRSAQKEANGLECDKLSKAAAESHFAAMVGELAKQAGPLAGKVLVSTHIDSWEAGSGNWTKGFRDEFRRRRGYDLLPYLPTLNGMVVDSREISERFLWDYRETVSELLLENYAGHFRELAHRQGLRLTIEAYDGTCDDLRYAGRADEPMTEFWRSCYSGLPLSDLSEGMASAAHVYGKRILGAEAFTSGRGDFLDHPATLKPMADWAFCTGVNRFCFSEWIMQPWPRLAPGVSFNLLGTVFQRTLTWWPQSRPWHEYIARCQYLLRQGQFVADICFVVPEGAPCRFTPPISAIERGGIPDRPEYNFDGCPPELVLKEMTVQDGMVVLPSGMKYRLLVLPTYNAGGKPVVRLMNQPDYFYKPAPLPEVQTMTPELLRRIKELVEAGATVLGPKPLKSPSLAGFPACDEQVEDLADELWGNNSANTVAGERSLGKGRVLWGSSPEQVLAKLGVPPDFSCDPDLKGKLNYTHRRMEDGSEVYFVVNQGSGLVQGTCSFRITGKQPHWYWPQTGRAEPAQFFEEVGGVTRMPICLQSNESVFVVFRRSAILRPTISVLRDGEELWQKTKRDPEYAGDSFIMAAWVRPGPDIVLPKETSDGWAFASNDVQYPAIGYQTFASPGQGRRGFAVGKNGILVYQFNQSGAVEPLLVYAAPITTAMLVGVVYKDGIPKLYLNGKLVKSGPASRFVAGGPYGWADRRPFAGEVASLQQFQEMLRSAGDDDLAAMLMDVQDRPACDFTRSEIWKSGAYVFKTADGKTRQKTILLPSPQEITGAWQVEFDPKWGGPPLATFEKLQDWSTHPEDGIKYYSGIAGYRKTFDLLVPPDQSPRAKLYLDLGKVAVIAEVTLNGKNLGTLWNAPYRVDVTQTVKATGNTLEVKVVNLWVNRLIGDEHLPEDSERDAVGGVKTWPQWVQEGKTSPTGRFTFTSYRQWTRDSPLVQSGLLGPVKLLRSERVEH